MSKLVSIAKLSLAILFGALLGVGMFCMECEAGQQPSASSSEAVRRILRQYIPGGLVDYMAVRQDKLVSFQPSLLATPDISLFKTEQAKRMGAGVFFTDGFYCLAFGKNAEAAKYYEAYYRLLRELPLRDLADIDMKPSPAVETFFKDPSKVSDGAELEKMVREMDQRIIANLDKLAVTQEGIQFAIDFFYACEIEAIHLVAQSVVQSDGKSEGAIAALAAVDSNIEFVKKLLAVAESNAALKSFFEIPEKEAILDPVLKLLKEKAGKLSKADAMAILKTVSLERKRIVSGSIAGKTAR